MPTVGAANILEVGDLYEANGFVKIKRASDVFSGSSQAATAVGTVTVVIT